MSRDRDVDAAMASLPKDIPFQCVASGFRRLSAIRCSASLGVDGVQLDAHHRHSLAVIEAQISRTSSGLDVLTCGQDAQDTVQWRLQLTGNYASSNEAGDMCVGHGFISFQCERSQALKGALTGCVTEVYC
jgi:hypothetical protein